MWRRGLARTLSDNISSLYKLPRLVMMLLKIWNDQLKRKNGLSMWLHDGEGDHGLRVYQTGHCVRAWSQRCQTAIEDSCDNSIAVEDATVFIAHREAFDLLRCCSLLFILAGA